METYGHKTWNYTSRLGVAKVLVWPPIPRRTGWVVAHAVTGGLCVLLLFVRFVYIWGTSIYGVGWGGDINVLTTTSLIVRPDDYVLHTTLSTYMFSWGCNMLLRWHYVGVGGVGWGGVEWRYQRPDDYVLDSTSWRLRPWYYVVNNMFSWGCNMLLYVDTTLGWVGWGRVEISTSWRLRPW